MKLSWLTCWRTFKRTKRHYPGTGTYTTTDGTVTIWCPSVQQSAATLPRNLKRLREAKGLSPTRLANQAGISASYLRWLENAGHPAKILPAPGDTVNPGIVICLRLARVLECGIEELVEGREP